MLGADLSRVWSLNMDQYCGFPPSRGKPNIDGWKYYLVGGAGGVIGDGVMDDNCLKRCNRMNSDEHDAM